MKPLTDKSHQSKRTPTTSPTNEQNCPWTTPKYLRTIHTRNRRPLLTIKNISPGYLLIPIGPFSCLQISGYLKKKWLSYNLISVVLQLLATVLQRALEVVNTLTSVNTANVIHAWAPLILVSKALMLWSWQLQMRINNYLKQRAALWKKLPYRNNSTY